MTHDETCCRCLSRHASCPSTGRVSKPRFHTIPDGQPIPSAQSRGWVEFPELVATQEVKLRAPDEPGNWWLILNNGNKLVARVPFNVVDWFTMLALKRDELMARGVGGSGPDAATASAPAVPAPPVLVPASPSNSPRGSLRLVTPKGLTTGERFDVVLTLSYVSPDDGEKPHLNPPTSRRPCRCANRRPAPGRFR